MPSKDTHVTHMENAPGTRLSMMTTMEKMIVTRVLFATKMIGPQLFAGPVDHLFAPHMDHIWLWDYLITSKMKHRNSLTNTFVERVQQKDANLNKKKLWIKNSKGIPLNIFLQYIWQKFGSLSDSGPCQRPLQGNARFLQRVQRANLLKLSNYHD